MTEPNARSHYFGKYRGTVANNIDPMQKGRLQVAVPAVYGTNQLNWALPCTPFAGSGYGIYMIPDIGTNIWVEFEGGDINAPIWSGCFWGDGECPGEVPQIKIIKTQAATITLDEVDAASPVVIKTPSGNRITITGQGITLESAGGAKIELAGPKVSINGSALEVE